MDGHGCLLEMFVGGDVHQAITRIIKCARPLESRAE